MPGRRMPAPHFAPVQELPLPSRAIAPRRQGSTEGAGHSRRCVRHPGLRRCAAEHQPIRLLRRSSHAVRCVGQAASDLPRPEAPTVPVLRLQARNQHQCEVLPLSRRNHARRALERGRAMSVFWLVVSVYLLVALLAARHALRNFCPPWMQRRASVRDIVGAFVLAIVWPAWPALSIVVQWREARQHGRRR